VIRIRRAHRAPAAPRPTAKDARPRWFRRTRWQAAAAVVAGVALLTGCQQPMPSTDAFYQGAAFLPPLRPGAIVRSRPSVFTLDATNYTPVPGVTSTQILYESTDARGLPKEVTGTVLVPSTPWTGPGARPLVSYGVGTRGIGDDCAPSYTLANGYDYEGGLIDNILARGIAVVVSDYQGLGTPGEHTYMVGRAQGHAVLDAARAALRLPGTGFTRTTPIGVMGYSQGGASAGWAAELAPTYAPELNLKGVTAGGVPADLNAVVRSLDGGPFFSFALLAAVGYDAAYPDLHLSSYLNATGTALLHQAQSMCLVSVDGFFTLLGTAFHSIPDYTTTNPLDTPAWQERLRENKLGSGRPTVPVLQYQALVDEIVPFGQASDLRSAWCAKGVNVTWQVMPLAEHALGLVEGAGPALDYMTDRFDNKPVTGNC
jgi:hypothetical protein